MILPSIRRLTIFAGIFGGLMALVIWQAGGIRGDRPRAVTGPTSTQPPAGITDFPGIGGIGPGRGVRATKDAVAPVNGQPVPYRVWAAWWEREMPRDGDAVDQHVLATEDFHILFFHTLPTERDPYPRAVEGPNTTRIDAARAEWDSGASQKLLRADLLDDVVVTHHGADSDLVLRTDRLFAEEVTEGGRERQIARTDAPVTIEQEGLNLSGTGLDLELDARPVATLQRDVRAEIVTGTALIGAPSLAEGEQVPAVITCSGSARLEALERSPARNARRRWKATFRENVVVEQGTGRLETDVLELEFLSGGDRDRSHDDVLLVVANGHVIAGTRDDAAGSAWTIETSHMRTSRGRKQELVTTLGRGTTMHFTGALGDTKAAGGSAETGRVEVHCDGQATLTTDAKPPLPGKPARTRVRFTENATFRQWDAAGTLTGEVTAPEILLLGTRVVDPDGRTRPAPDALTATGDEKTPVQLLHRGARATSRTMLWKTNAKTHLERVLLNGNPVARFDDPSGWNPLGGGDAPRPAVLELSAGEEIELQYTRLPDTAATGAEDGAAPAVTAPAAHGRGGVTLRRLADDVETYRLEAQTLDVTFDEQQRPVGLRAYGKAHMWGRGDGLDAPQLDLHGERFRALRQGNGDPTAGDLWTDTELGVYGDSRAPARAVFEVPSEKDAPRRTHEIRAHEIHYEQQGTVVVARRDAVAEINRRAAGQPGSDGVLDDMKVSGGEIRAEILPKRSATTTTELMRIVATSPAVVWTKTYQVTGDQVTYDHRAGTAAVSGRPARAIMQERGTNPRPEYQSLVVSKQILVEFDGRLVGAGNAEPRRLRCDGGRVVLHDAGSPSKKSGGAAAMSRTTVVAAGPIHVQRGFASAERDVEIRVESEIAPGRWQQTARLTCERANLDLDPQARGGMTGRIRHATAVGTKAAPVRAESGGVIAHADRAEIEGEWIHFSSPHGRRVSIVQTDDDGTRSEFTFDSGWWNMMTHEWDRFQRMQQQ